MATPTLNTDPSSTPTNPIHKNSILTRAIHPENNPQRVSHETRSLITFITLLLHALLLLVFAYLNPPERLPGIRSARKEAELIVMPNRPQAKPKTAPQPKPALAPPAPVAKPEPVTLAARTARTSKFGMPLQDQDIDTQDFNFDAQAEKIQEAMPEKAPLSSPLNQASPDLSPQVQRSQEIKQEPVLAPQIATPENKQESKKQESLQESEALPLKPELLAKQITEQTKESVTLADLPKPALAPKAEPKTTLELSKKQNIAAESSVTAPEHKHREPIPALVPVIQATHTTPQARKQLPSMAQLARGFLNTLKENTPGDSNMTVHGDKNKKPTAEQLKIERYTEKIAWHIQNSLRIHNDKRPNITLSPNETPITGVAIFVRKNGTIRDVRVVTPSGIPALDNFYLFGIKEADGSFPPIPDYLHVDEFNVGFSIYTAHHSRIF